MRLFTMAKMLSFRSSPLALKGLEGSRKGINSCVMVLTVEAGKSDSAMSGEEVGENYGSGFTSPPWLYLFVLTWCDDAFAY